MPNADSKTKRKGESMAKEKTSKITNKNTTRNTKQEVGKQKKSESLEQMDVIANNKYKDTLFRFIFNDKKRLLGLYNALNHSNYQNAEELEINTLENAIYLSMKNDLSFIFDLSLYIFEHQSTYCPNIPLRDLHYVSTLLEGMIQKKYIYSTKLVKFPTPHFIVFYNGEKEMPDRTILKLSDAFEKPEEDPELELKVTMINVNCGRNPELMEACKDLNDYSIYVQKVRIYAKIMDINEAVEKAITECIEGKILEEILTKFRSEAKMLSIMEYDKELHEQTIKEDYFEEGREIGREEGEIRNLLKLIQKKMIKAKTYETIAEELELDVFVVEQIGNVIKNIPKDTTQEELIKILVEQKILD